MQGLFFLVDRSLLKSNQIHKDILEIVEFTENSIQSHQN